MIGEEVGVRRGDDAGGFTTEVGEAGEGTGDGVQGEQNLEPRTLHSEGNGIWMLRQWKAQRGQIILGSRF